MHERRWSVFFVSVFHYHFRGQYCVDRKVLFSSFLFFGFVLLSIRIFFHTHCTVGIFLISIFLITFLVVMYNSSTSKLSLNFLSKNAKKRYVLVQLRAEDELLLAKNGFCVGVIEWILLTRAILAKLYIQFFEI